MQAIVDLFSLIGQELTLFLVSMVPLIELRGAVPIGAAMGMNFIEVLLICIVGNMVPIPFILLFGNKLFAWFRRTRLFAKLFGRIETKLRGKMSKVTKYEKWGLFFFVAIPLPGTGAWSGAAIAVLLEMKPKEAFWSIFCGVIAAGVIMALGSYGVFGAVSLLGGA